MIVRPEKIGFYTGNTIQNLISILTRTAQINYDRKFYPNDEERNSCEIIQTTRTEQRPPNENP